MHTVYMMHAHVAAAAAAARAVFWQNGWARTKTQKVPKPQTNMTDGAYDNSPYTRGI